MRYEGDLLPHWRDEEVKRYWNRELDGLAAIRELQAWAPKAGDLETGACRPRGWTRRVAHLRSLLATRGGR